MRLEVPERVMPWMIAQGFEVVSVRKDNSGRYFNMILPEWR